MTTPSRYTLQHVGFHGVEGVGRVGETARRKICFHLLQKGFARRLRFQKRSLRPSRYPESSVGVARNSLTLNPRSPGNVVHPNW